MRRLRAPNIVGRGEEVATLRHAVAGALAGSGGCVFLLGEAGSGKTRLLDEVREVATSAGLRVLHAVAPAALTPPPFAVLGAAFRFYLRHTAPPLGDELRPFTAGLRQVLPEWPGARETLQLSDDQLQALALEGSLRLVLALARDRGLLLVLDDLHWADSQTLAFVQHVAPALLDARVLLVGAVRSGEPGPARNEVSALYRRGVATLLPLRPLEVTSVGALAGAILGTPPPPQLSAYVAERSGGVPLFVEQLIEANLAAGALSVQAQELSWDPERAAAVPQTTAEFVSEQLKHLPGSALSLVRAVAVAGQADATLLGKVCLLAEDGLATAISRHERRD